MDLRRWLTYATCTWAILFGAPHLWWALGVRFGFPGGDASYEFFFASAWRMVFDWVVIACSVIAFFVPLTLIKPAASIARRWIPHTVAWIGSALLSIRGVAGAIADGASDPVWWPTFLIGGILLGSVAWLARRSAQPA